MISNIVPKWESVKRTDAAVLEKPLTKTISTSIFHSLCVWWIAQKAPQSPAFWIPK